MLSIAQAKTIVVPGDRSVLALLFGCADPDAADAANMHLDSRKDPIFQKVEGEGRAFSGHALTELTPRGQNTFRVLLENADRRGNARTKQMLRRGKKQVFKNMELTVANADGQAVAAAADADMVTVANDRLNEGAVTGILSEITVTDSRPIERGLMAQE